MQESSTLLAGDIGGTKTTLALFTTNRGPYQPLAEATFRSGDYANLETIAGIFLKQHNVQASAAVFGVAGPVEHGAVAATNLPWQMSEATLSSALNIPHVHLMNDLAAIATAVPILTADDRYTLNAGQPDPAGPIAVIAPGTGLGEAFLLHDGAHYRAYPSEGGHADFAPGNSYEDGLLVYMRQFFQHVSWERVCSGLAMPHLYNYVITSGRASEPAWLATELAAAIDPTPIIINTALDSTKDAPVCQEAVRLFVSILGTEAGNMALKLLATGGVYLGGGIPPRILSFLEEEAFLTAFRLKGRFSPFMVRTPVHVILNPQAALLGAAHYGLTNLLSI
jgi:glucokinase